MPPWFDVPPSRVGLGAEPKHQGNGTATWPVFLFHASQKDVKPRIPHAPGREEAEQWMPTAELQANVRGEGPLWWFAEYPGTGCSMSSWREEEQRDCGVEHPSRACTAAEAAEDARNGLNPRDCARPHAFVGRDRVGEGGGPPGARTVCVAPHGRPAEAECRRWFLGVDGSIR